MFEVLEAGGVCTIQDSGRLGWRRFGVPASGPMDEFALLAANLLVGNGPGAAAIEIGAGDLVLEARRDTVMAVAGEGYELTVNVWKYPLWGSYFVRQGWAVRLQKAGPGMWAYIAVGGGFETSPVLGSHSTYLRGRFGGIQGQTLQAGQLLHAGPSVRGIMETAGRTIKETCRPAYTLEPELEVIGGPQRERLEDESVRTFFSAAYRVSTDADRMGYRLEGPKLAHSGSPDLLSEGITPGCIQVPANGFPIVTMADSATTGGYPKIGCVIRADLALLAQCRPGKDQVRFGETTIDAAQQKYVKLVQALRNGLAEAE